MGTLIESVAVRRSRSGAFARTSLQLADRAALDCLISAGRRPDELDVLVNTGIYHDKNIGEPAVASLIQEDISANPGHPPTVGAHGTFSFDVLNGTCGVLTAAYLVDGFMRSGAARLGMVVAGDVDPGRKSSGYEFDRSGAAMLLAWDDSQGGFTDFHFQTFPEFQQLFHSEVSWREVQSGWPPRRRSGNVLEVVTKPEYLERSLESAAIAVREFLERTETDPATVDLIVAAHTSAEFATILPGRLPFLKAPIVSADDPYQRTHTSLPIAALQAAYRTRLIRQGKKVLIVAAGAGISVALALYRPSGGVLF